MSNATAVLDEVMESAPPQERTDAAILSGIPERLADELPAWFRDQQRTAWSEFLAAPMPSRKDQAWRFSNVSALDLAPYRSATRLVENDHASLIQRSRGIEDAAGRLVFANEQLLAHDLLPEKLRARGVIFQPLERAMVEHEDLFRRHFMSQPTPLGSAKFAALHQAHVRSGAFLYVPRGVEIETPIEIFHWLSGSNVAVFPHLLLVADETSKVTVIEHFQSADARQPGFACGVNDLVAGAGANLTYACLQNWGENVVAVQMNATTVSRDAAATSLNANLGGRYSRFESFSRLIGEGARSDLLAISVGHGEQEFDARTLQDHKSPHTTSDLLYKNALDDRARTTFGGLIRVEPHAHFTDAYQTVRNLLLSDDAEANSMPGLEILADNVKCSHGATSGQLNEEEMFYLLARGIPDAVARRLLVAGFLHETVERVKNPMIRDLVGKLVESKFARRA